MIQANNEEYIQVMPHDHVTIAETIAKAKEDCEPTHLLIVDMAPGIASDPLFGQPMLKLLWDHLQNPQVETVRGLRVTVQWRTKGDPTTALYYYTEPSIWSDLVLFEFTKLMTRRIKREMDAKFGHLFADGNTRFSLVLVKPLSIDRAFEPEEITL